MMVVVDGSGGAGGWMDTVAVVRVDRRAVVVVVRMDRAVRRMRMRITRMGERRMRRVGMVPKGVHGVVRMTRMVRVVRVVSVVNSMRMVTAVVVMVMMARMRAQICSCRSGSGTVRQAEEVGQVLPPMLHAHRAHKRHAHLKIIKREIIFTFDFSNERTVYAHALEM